MRFDFRSNGHGEGKGKLAVTQIADDCSTFYSSQEQAVEEEYMPLSLTGMIMSFGVGPVGQT